MNFILLCKEGKSATLQRQQQTLQSTTPGHASCQKKCPVSRRLVSTLEQIHANHNRPVECWPGAGRTRTPRPRSLPAYPLRSSSSRGTAPPTTAPGAPQSEATAATGTKPPGMVMSHPPPLHRRHPLPPTLPRATGCYGGTVGCPCLLEPGLAGPGWGGVRTRKKVVVGHFARNPFGPTLPAAREGGQRAGRGGRRDKNKGEGCDLGRRRAQV